MKRVTGLGGVFLKCKDKPAMLAWYTKHLGISMETWGAVFEPKVFLEEHPKGSNVFSFFEEKSDYFQPSNSSFMVNFTVADLDSLLPQLKSEGVNVLDQTDSSEFGKFGWVIDPEGNKIELWEPPH
jgi:predicted enzyme related to lactoylglutathione lyase